MVGNIWKRKTAGSSLAVFRETEDAEQRARLLYTLLFGFFAGILGMVIKQENLLYNTGFLDSYTLSPIKYLEPDVGKLLPAILMQRLGAAVLLIILATTYLGSAAAYLYQIWSGLALGIWTAGSMIRYGAKGLLLLAGSLLPQQLILLPVYLMLATECCELCRVMYFRKSAGEYQGGERKKILLERGLHMVFCTVIIAAGCFVEAYLNPEIFKMILKFF